MDSALVHCPTCDRQATVRTHADGLRLTCIHCGHSQQTRPPRHHWEWGGPSGITFERYEKGDPPFDARLWLETECCGGKRLWALNEVHLDYLAGFVAETQRNREFPSPSGGRQLAYKLPKWMKLAKNRREILRAIDHLRMTMQS